MLYALVGTDCAYAISVMNATNLGWKAISWLCWAGSGEEIATPRGGAKKGRRSRNPGWADHGSS